MKEASDSLLKHVVNKQVPSVEAVATTLPESGSNLTQTTLDL